MKELQDRVDALETTAAHQAHAIDDLNRIITEQWTIIDRLKRAYEQLSDRVQEAERSARQAGPAEPPPPHY
jgi:SlyX protein